MARQSRALIEAAAPVEQVIAIEQRCVDRQMPPPSRPELLVRASGTVAGRGAAKATRIAML